MAPLNTVEGRIIWLGALATLALYTVLYRENRVYRTAEHLFVGLAAGYGAYLLWSQVLYPKWWVPMVQEGRWPWALALVCGALYYTIYSKRYAWMSRLIMLTMMGFEAGQQFKRWAGIYVDQIGSSMVPIFYQPLRPPYVHLDNVLFVVILIAVMIYFLFSFEQKRPAIRATASLGRWLMMIAFGAIFGSTVMARMSLFIGRLWFLFAEWIHLIPQR
jgi:hypothetical protein